jgi:hypothetical protein
VARTRRARSGVQGQRGEAVHGRVDGGQVPRSPAGPAAGRGSPRSPGAPRLVPPGRIAKPMGWSPTTSTRWRKAPSPAASNVRPVVGLPAVPTGCPLVRFGLLPKRFGMQLPGVLRPLSSRLRTITVPKALLHPGPLLVQLLGATVGGKLTRLRPCSAFPCSRHLVRLARPSLPIPQLLPSVRQPTNMNRTRVLEQHKRAAASRAAWPR